MAVFDWQEMWPLMAMGMGQGLLSAAQPQPYGTNQWGLGLSQGMQGMTGSFQMAMQMKQMQAERERKQRQEEMEQQRFGLEQQRFGLRKEQFGFQQTEASRKAAEPPDYGAPITVIGPDGNPVLVRYPKTGAGAPIPGGGGYGPAPTTPDQPARLQLIEWAQQNLGMSVQEASAWSREASQKTDQQLMAELYMIGLRASFGDPADAQRIAEEGMKFLRPTTAAPTTPGPGLVAPPTAEAAPGGGLLDWLPSLGLGDLFGPSPQTEVDIPVPPLPPPSAAPTAPPPVPAPAVPATPQRPRPIETPIAAPVLPNGRVNRSKLVVGQVYQGPNGETYRWNGTIMEGPL